MLQFLTAPYIHYDRGVMDTRKEYICHTVIVLKDRGYNVIAPILHHAVIAETTGYNLGLGNWQDLNNELLSKCDRLFVLCLPGWESSVSVHSKVDFARQNNIPIEYIEL
jgi:hypothetical protein